MRKFVFSAQHRVVAAPGQPPVSRTSVSRNGSDETSQRPTQSVQMMVAHAKTSTPPGSFPFHPMSAINAAMQFQNAKLFTLDFGPQTADETLAPKCAFLHSGLWTLDESPNPVQNNFRPSSVWPKGQEHTHSKQLFSNDYYMTISGDVTGHDSMCGLDGN